MKYGNIRQNGFDSKKEMTRYKELQLLERAGKISDLRRQVRYRLIGSQVGFWRKEYPADYIADFVYTENGETVVEDVKGVKTRDYVLKRKLMLKVYGISIKET